MFQRFGRALRVATHVIAARGRGRTLGTIYPRCYGHRAAGFFNKHVANAARVARFRESQRCSVRPFSRSPSVRSDRCVVASLQGGGLSRDITRTRLRFHALTQRGFIGCTTATPVCALLCLLIPGQLSWTGQDRPVTVRRRVVVVCARVCLQYMGLYCSVFDCQSPVSASNSHIFTNQPRRTEPASFDV